MPLPLIERSAQEITKLIKRKVEELEDVRDCHHVSARMIGKRIDVDMHISLDSNLRFEEVHEIASHVEAEVKRLIPNSRVTVHTEPLENARQSLGKLVKEMAETVPGSRGVHNIHVQKINGKTCIDLHLEVGANMTVKQAHDISDQVEKKIRSANPNISEITVHMESAQDRITRELEGGRTELRWYLEHAAKRIPEIKTVHGIKVRKVDGAVHVVLHCHLDQKTSMKQAHEISIKLENMIKSAYPEVARIDIHEEPA